VRLRRKAADVLLADQRLGEDLAARVVAEVGFSVSITTAAFAWGPCVKDLTVPDLEDVDLDVLAGNQVVGVVEDCAHRVAICMSRVRPGTCRVEPVIYPGDIVTAANGRTIVPFDLAFVLAAPTVAQTSDKKAKSDRRKHGGQLIDRRHFAKQRDLPEEKRSQGDKQLDRVHAGHICIVPQVGDIGEQQELEQPVLGHAAIPGGGARAPPGARGRGCRS
jgi:hypothetical protein